MVSEKVTLINPQGLHMRPAGTFASAMGKFASTVTIVANGKETNGKSPMALMAAGLSCGTEVEVKCDGADEADALAAAVELIKSGIGEKHRSWPLGGLARSCMRMEGATPGVCPLFVIWQLVRHN